MAFSEYNKNKKILNEKIRSLKKNKDTAINNNVSAEDLYDRYRKNKITDDEYSYLLKNTLNKITVYQKIVVFDTKFGIFERKRKIMRRQKGLTKH